MRALIYVLIVACIACTPVAAPIAKEQRTVFSSISEASAFYKSNDRDWHNGDCVECVIDGCYWVIWCGSHGEIGFSHIGKCINEIHKCKCK